MFLPRNASRVVVDAVITRTESLSHNEALSQELKSTIAAQVISLIRQTTSFLPEEVFDQCLTAGESSSLEAIALSSRVFSEERSPI